MTIFLLTLKKKIPSNVCRHCFNFLQLIMNLRLVDNFLRIFNVYRATLSNIFLADRGGAVLEAS